MARDRQKHTVIANLLNRSISSTYTVLPSYGKAEYFEYILQNPLATEVTISVVCTDPECHVITNSDEWRYFSALKKTGTPIEDRVFARDDSGNPSVHLAPNERISIPFKFQSFKIGAPLMSSNIAVDADTAVPKTHVHMNIKGYDGGIRNRIIRVQFLTADHRPVATLDVNVVPRPFSVDQTFRFWQPEGQFFKQTILMPDKTPHFGSDASYCIQCSSDVVQFEARSQTSGQRAAVRVKYPCSTAPEIAFFCLVLYPDQYMAEPSEIWQFFVHSVSRIELPATMGEVTQAKITLRGYASSRSVCCYSSNPSELQVRQHGPFMLVMNSINEISIALRPASEGVSSVYVTLVDTHAKTLLYAWMVNVTATLPPVSKVCTTRCSLIAPTTCQQAFEVLLPLSTRIDNRIAYTNPYQQKRVFRLHTNRPDIIHLPRSVCAASALSFASILIAVQVLELQPGQQDVIGQRSICRHYIKSI